MSNRAWFLSVFLFLLAAMVFSEDVAMTVRADGQYPVYEFSSAVDLFTALGGKPSDYQYQTDDSFRTLGVSSIEQWRLVGKTPLVIAVPPGKHVFRVNAGTMLEWVTEGDRVQTWTVHRLPDVVSNVVGWSILGGLIGITAFAGPSYIDTENHRTGIGSIGYMISGGALVAGLLSAVFTQPNVGRDL